MASVRAIVEHCFNSERKLLLHLKLLESDSLDSLDAAMNTNIDHPDAVLG